MPNVSEESDLPKIGRPALLALNAAGIYKLEQVKNYTDTDLLMLHGMGPKALHILREALKMDQAKTIRQHAVRHKDGSIWAQGKVLNGLPDGYWEWFRIDGTKIRSGYFKDGKQTGEWVTYNKQGEPYKITLLSKKPRS